METLWKLYTNPKRHTWLDSALHALAPMQGESRDKLASYWSLLLYCKKISKTLADVSKIHTQGWIFYFDFVVVDVFAGFPVVCKKIMPADITLYWELLVSTRMWEINDFLLQCKCSFYCCKCNMLHLRINLLNWVDHPNHIFSFCHLYLINVPWKYAWYA